MKNIWNSITSLFKSKKKEKSKKELKRANILCNCDIYINDFSFITYYYIAIYNSFFQDISFALNDLNKSKQLIINDITFIINFICVLPEKYLFFKEYLNQKNVLLMNINENIIIP